MKDGIDDGWDEKESDKKKGCKRKVCFLPRVRESFLSFTTFSSNLEWTQERNVVHFIPDFLSSSFLSSSSLLQVCTFLLFVKLNCCCHINWQ